MKKRKYSLFLNISVLCLCLAVVAFGVYSAKNASLAVSGSVGFNAHNCDVYVYATMSGGMDKNTFQEYVAEDFGEDSENGFINVHETTESWNFGTPYFDDINLTEEEMNAGKIAKDITFTIKMYNKSKFSVNAVVNPEILLDNDNYKISTNKEKLVMQPNQSYTNAQTIVITASLKSETDLALPLSNIILIDFAKGLDPDAVQIYSTDCSAEVTLSAGGYGLPTEVISENQSKAVSYQGLNESISTLQVQLSVKNTSIYTIVADVDFEGAEYVNIKRTIDDADYLKVIEPNATENITFTFAKNDTSKLASFTGPVKLNIQDARVNKFSKFVQEGWGYSQGATGYIVEKLPEPKEGQTSITIPSFVYDDVNGTNTAYKVTQLFSESNLEGLTSVDGYETITIQNGINTISILTGLDINVGMSNFFSYPYVLRDSNVKNLRLPSSLVSLPILPFSGFKNLKNIYIPSGLTDLDTSFGSSHILYATDIDFIKVSSGNIAYNDGGNGNVLISTSDNKMLRGSNNMRIPENISGYNKDSFPFAELSKITEVPNEYFTTIFTENNGQSGSRAFVNCASLKSVTIPRAYGIGSYAFANCVSLSEVDVTSVSQIDPTAFANTNCKFIIDTDNNANGNYKVDVDCNVLTNTYGNTIKIANNISTIPTTGVTTLDCNAFYGSKGLKEITIPANITKIEATPFGGCSPIIKIDSANTKYRVDSEHNVIIDKTTNVLVAGCDNSTIPTNIDTIGEYAFRDCEGLESIVIPSNIKTIKRYAFYDSGLKHITLSEGLETIEKEVFSWCSLLEELTIPASVKTLFDGFMGANGFTLKNLTFVNTENWTYLDCKPKEDEYGNYVTDGNGNIVIVGTEYLDFTDDLTDTSANVNNFVYDGDAGYGKYYYYKLVKKS